MPNNPLFDIIYRQPQHVDMTKHISPLDKMMGMADEARLIGINPMGEAVGPVGAPTGLVGALKPLAKGSLARGSELASELAGRAKEYVSKAPTARAGTPARTLADFLNTAQPEVIDPNKVAAMSKATGARPPIRSSIQLPEGFTTNPSGTPVTPGEQWYFTSKGPRDPEVARLGRIWSAYERAQRMRFGGKAARVIDQPPLSSLSNKKPELSGKFSKRNRGRVGADSPPKDSPYR